MAKHRTYWGIDCPGAGATPVPIPVREPDCTPAGYFDGRLLDRWDFLSLPLLVLLHTTRADVREIAQPDFAGSIHPASGRWRWTVWMPIGGDILDHELTVRGLLAAVHGIDIDDWPVEMAVRKA